MSQTTIERAISTPSTTGGSFQRELRQEAWRRCRLLFITGLGITVASAIVHVLAPPAEPALDRLAPLGWALGSEAHAASLLLALAALYLVRRDLRFLNAIAFATVAFNLLLAVYNQSVSAPAADSYFAVSLLLFLTAAFIPWRIGYAIGLAVTVTVFHLGLNLLLYDALPEFGAYWAERGGAVAFRDHLLWSVSGLAILGAASVVVSGTLYRLRKTAHRAQRLGNYLIRGELGGGGMGRVYVAQHALMCRPTAVKVVRADGADGADATTALARFEREVRLSAGLTHPNTITIYDVGRTPERSLYYAMEYLEGMDLQRLVERTGPLPPERAVHILAQACGSLSEAHARNVIHRDIKPSNVFLTRRGGLYDFVKVLDFGLAKQIRTNGSSEITKSGALFGTPRYLAPEMVYGNESVDGRADIYCLGGVAYWILTGQPPFTSESSVEVVIDHVKTAPRRPSEVSELPVPGELEEIVMKCLAKRPADRFQSAAELEAALLAIPFERPWTRERAREWWSLHGLTDGEGGLDCECWFRDDEAEDGVHVALKAAETAV